MEIQSGGPLSPIAYLMPELPGMILQGFIAELAQNIWLLVPTQCVQNWSGKVGRRIKSHQIPGDPLPTVLWFYRNGSCVFFIPSQARLY